MSLSLGLASAKQSIEEAGKGAFPPASHPIYRADIFSLKDKQTALLRFLSTEVLVFPFHNFLSVNGSKPRDYACTSELKGELKRPCWICANVKKEGKRGGSFPARPTRQIIGLAVAKDADTGKVETKQYEILSDPDDPESDPKEVTAPRFVIVKQSNSFWDQLIEYANEYDGTLVDRDYKVKRKGEKLETKYSILPGREDGKTEADLWSQFELPEASDGFSDPTVQALYEWVSRRGTPEYFAALTQPVDDDSSSSSDEGKSSPWDDDDEPKESSGGFAALRQRAQAKIEDYD